MKFRIFPTIIYAALRYKPLIYNNFYLKNVWQAALLYGNTISSLRGDRNLKKGEWYGKPHHSRAGRRDLCRGSDSKSQLAGAEVAVANNREILRPAYTLCGPFSCPKYGVAYV